MTIGALLQQIKKEQKANYQTNIEELRQIHSRRETHTDRKRERETNYLIASFTSDCKHTINIETYTSNHTLRHTETHDQKHPEIYTDRQTATYKDTHTHTKTFR